MLKERNIDKREQDALFALGSNFFAQGRYRHAKIIFDGLKALMPKNNAFLKAAEECKNRFMGSKKLGSHKSN